MRSSGGKNASSSNTPSLRNGGCLHLRRRAPARSRSWPLGPGVLATRLASRMCSRLDSGSASMPTSPSSPDTNPSTSSAMVSASVPSGGRLQAADHVQRHAARRPRRVDREPGGVAQRLDPRRRRCPNRPDPPSSAWRPPPASPPSTQGANDSGARSGNVSSRLPRSPFGSRTRVGDALEQRLLQQARCRARLARPGHADDHAVGREVGGLEEHRLARALVLLVDRFPYVEVSRGNVDHRRRH